MLVLRQAAASSRVEGRPETLPGVRRFNPQNCASVSTSNREAVPWHESPRLPAFRRLLTQGLRVWHGRAVHASQHKAFAVEERMGFRVLAVGRGMKNMTCCCRDHATEMRDTGEMGDVDERTIPNGHGAVYVKELPPGDPLLQLFRRGERIYICPSCPDHRHLLPGNQG